MPNRRDNDLINVITRPVAPVVYWFSSNANTTAVDTVGAGVRVPRVARAFEFVRKNNKKKKRNQLG